MCECFLGWTNGKKSPGSCSLQNSGLILYILKPTNRLASSPKLQSSRTIIVQIKHQGTEAKKKARHHFCLDQHPSLSMIIILLIMNFIAQDQRILSPAFLVALASQNSKANMILATPFPPAQYTEVSSLHISASAYRESK